MNNSRLTCDICLVSTVRRKEDGDLVFLAANCGMLRGLVVKREAGDAATDYCTIVCVTDCLRHHHVLFYVIGHNLVKFM